MQTHRYRLHFYLKHVSIIVSNHPYQLIKISMQNVSEKIIKGLMNFLHCQNLDLCSERFEQEGKLRMCTVF